MRNSTKTLVALAVASSLAFTSVNAFASGTSTIIDAIEAEKNTMNQVVVEYDQINHDFALANQMEKEMIASLDSNSVTDITLQGKQMIQKKLSGINSAIQQVDKLFASSERMEGLIRQLISQTTDQAKKNLSHKAKRENYLAAAKQASGTYQTLTYLLGSMPNLNAYERSELENTLYASKSALDKYSLQKGEVNLEDSLNGLERVFSSLSTKLLVEKQNLANLSNHYISLDYTLVAVDTEDKLTTLVNGLQSVMGKIGRYSHSESAIELRDKLLQRRRRNTIVTPATNNTRYDDIVSKIEEGEI